MKIYLKKKYKKRIKKNNSLIFKKFYTYKKRIKRIKRIKKNKKRINLFKNKTYTYII